ncbi:MAG: dTDP-4-dehydrorhamnose reductase [bacterium]|nr:dTDP-4-dehydrorhamnose reductase [Phycisphaerales bacterium]MCE2654298.1 dTDP-4-dehydrorhamnose reductase [Planctomycetaceae bacterium]
MSGPSRTISVGGFSLRPMPAPVLLIGHGGMLARAWRAVLERVNAEVVCPTLEQCDFTRPQTVRDVVNAREGGFGLVINCAAWTDVDGAEAKEDAAYDVNAEGPAVLAEACRHSGSLLVHYSTDYVFRGDASAPYSVDEPMAPVGAYGRTKAAGELALRDSGCRHLIIRTSWLYAPWGKNFVRTIAGLCKAKPSLKVVNDQRGRPTSAEHLAAASLALVQAGAGGGGAGAAEGGTWHITDGGECTWFDFAREINRVQGTACDVQPCTTAEFPRPARRPAYSVLDLSRTEAAIGPMPDWKANLADVMSRLEP